MKALNFLQYYLDEDIQFADDTKFWIKVGAEIAHVINNDQYIPSIVATKDKSKIKYYKKWQPFSFDFEKKLKKGDNIIFAAFGGGFTWGSIYLKSAYDTK